MTALALIVLWLVLALGVGIAATRRGRSRVGWFLLAVVISPMCAGPLLLALPDPRGQRIHQGKLRRLQECPHCAELIKVEDIVCHHCVREIPFPVFCTQAVKRRLYPYGLAVFMMATLAFLTLEGRAFWKGLFPDGPNQVALTMSMPMGSISPQESPELLRELKNHDVAEQASPAQLKQKPATNRVSPKSRPVAQRADASR